MSSASSVKAGQAQGVVGDYQLALDNGDLEGIVATLSTTATPASRVGGVCAPRRGSSTYGQYTKRCNFRLLFAPSTELPRAVILEKPEFRHCRFSGVNGCTTEEITGFAGDLHCAGGGTQTHTRLPSPDLESGLLNACRRTRRRFLRSEVPTQIHAARRNCSTLQEGSHPAYPEGFLEGDGT